MRITPDTNVLLRVLVSDDEAQAKAAVATLENAELIAITLQSLCELCWVLMRSYEVSRTDIGTALRALIEARNVVLNRPAAEAGLAILEAGGEFADGVIAHEGAWAGGETFVSFDRKAVALLVKQGREARLLG